MPIKWKFDYCIFHAWSEFANWKFKAIEIKKFFNYISYFEYLKSTFLLFAFICDRL